MATALSVGTKIGSVAGKVGAFAWSTTCRVASASGDLGEGFLAGADTGWDEQMVKEQAKVAAAQIKKDAVRAAMLARRESPAALASAPQVDMAQLAAAMLALQAKPAKAKA